MTEAVIFDMDGVIIDSEPIHTRVKMDTFHRFGFDFDEADLVHYMGRTSDDLFSAVAGEHGRPDLKDAMVEYKHTRYLEVLRGGTIEPVKGARTLIKNIYEAGVPLALATSSWPVVMDTVLDAFDIRKYFKSVLSGGSLPASKPDPAIYLISAERLGVAPEKCLVIEDTAAGITSAKRAGMYCVAFRNPHSGQQDLKMADEIVDDLLDVRWQGR